MRLVPGNVGSRALAAAALAVLGAGCARVQPVSAPAGPPGATFRVFPVPGHGAIELAIPKGWTAQAVNGDASATPTIRLEHQGQSFVALLTPFWNPSEPGVKLASGDTAQLFAELARRNAMRGASEREIPLQRLAGAGVRGFWFAATDRTLEGKEPGPEEWRHVVQGAAEVGALVLAFTLLDNEDGPQRREVLEVVGAARHLPPREGEQQAAEDMELDPGANTVPLRVEIRGKPWAVLVDLPGFRMFKPRRSDDGTGVLVLGQDPGSGVVASVILRPAGPARDAAGCRDADLPRIRDAAPELLELRLASSGASVRASYELAAPGAAQVHQEHGHAWLQREGICANVHVSKVAPGPQDAAVMDRILSSVRFGEDL